MNPVLYNEKLSDQNDVSTYMTKIPPPECTPLLTLLMHIFKQKYQVTLEEFQNCLVIVAANHKIGSMRG
jgi:hypothetical protein